MEKKKYFNSVVHQVKDLEVLADIQQELCFDLEKLKSMFPEKIAKKIKRIILTGCGDSFSAAGAMVPGVRKLSGVQKVNSPDIMDFCRYYDLSKITKGYALDEVLVIAISFSGSADRVVEALTKAKELGTQALLITRNPESKGAKVADLIFDVATPDGCNSPGLRSYYASMVGIVAVAAYIGLCRGIITKERFLEVKHNITSYTKTFMSEFDRIDDMMFAEAVRMKDLTKFEIIGDGNEGYSAQFIEEKFIECGGVYCDHTNSEEFAHISFFFRGPGEFGTVILVNEADPSLGRMKDTIYGCLCQHRPTVVVTDLPKEAFLVVGGRVKDTPDMYNIPDAATDSGLLAGEATVCCIPKAPEQWMSPLVDFIPGSLLAGYQAAVNERKYFAGQYDFRTETWITG